MGVKERYEQRYGISSTTGKSTETEYVGTAERYRRKLEEEEKKRTKTEDKSEPKRKAEENQQSSAKQNAVNRLESQRENKPTKTTGDELVNPWIVKKPVADSSPIRKNTLSEAKQTVSKTQTTSASDYVKKTALDKEKTARDYQTMKRDSAVKNIMQNSKNKIEAAKKKNEIVKSHNNNWEPTVEVKKPITKEEAEKQYADEFMREENRKQANRETLEYQQFGKEHPVIGTAASMVSNLGSAAGLIELGKAALDKDYSIDPNSKYFAPQRVTEALRSGAKENIDSKAGQTVYDIGTTVGDMMLTKFTTGPLGSLGYSASMAAQAAAGTAKDGAERDLSTNQILAESIASGALTAVCEKIGFDKVFKVKDANTISAVAKNVVKGFLAEGSEEAVEEAANIIVDRIIAQEQSKFELTVNSFIEKGYSPEEARIEAYKQMGSQIGQSFLVGGAAGGLISGFNSTAVYADNRFSGVDVDVPDSTDVNIPQNITESPVNPSVTEQTDNLPTQTQTSSQGEISGNNELDDFALDENDFYDSQRFAAESENKAAADDGFILDENDSAEWQEVEALLNKIDSEKAHTLSETIAQSRAVMADPNATPEQRNTAQSNAIKAQYDAETYEGIKDEIVERRKTGLGEAADIMADVHGKKVSVDTQAERKITDLADKLFGVKVNFVDSLGGMKNAKVDKDTRQITISRDSEGSLLNIFGHEVMHLFEGTTEYAQLVSHMKENDPYIRQLMADAEVDFNGLIKLKQEQYLSSIGENLSESDAISEIIADAIGAEFFTDENALYQLATQNRSVFTKFKQWFLRTTAKLQTTKMSESKAMKQTKRLLLRAEQASKNATSQKVANEKYSLVGVSADGRKIYKTDYPKGTPKSVKQKELINLVQNVWSKKPITLTVLRNGKPQKIVANFNPELGERTDLAKLAYGNKKGTSSEQRMTLDLASDFYQIAQDAQYTKSKAETGKSYNPAHEDVFNWDYFVTNILYQNENGENIDCHMNLDVKQNPDGHWFYSFAIKKGVAPQTLDAVVTDKSATTPINIISNSAENVKNSAKKSEVVKAIAEDYGFTDTSAQKLVSVAASMRKSTGSKADLNELSLNIANAITKAKNGTVADSDIDSITKLLADNATMRNDAFLDSVAEPLEYLKNLKISISQSDIADLGDAFSDIRRRAFPYTNIAKDGGMPVDELYQDLSAEFPKWFSAENTHPADQLNTIVGFIEYVKSNRTIGTYAEEDAYLELRNQVAAILTVPAENSSAYVSQLIELCKAYGELKNGVPKSIDGETRVRKTAASAYGTPAVQNNPELQERFAREFINGKFNYEVQLQGKEAADFIETIKSAPDVVTAFENAYRTCYDALAGGKPSPQEVLQASALLPMAKEYLVEDDFISFTSKLAEIGTRSGQIIAALRYIGQMNGAQRLKAIQRKVDEYNQKMSGKYADDKPNGGTFDENGQMQEDPDTLDPAISVWFKTRNAEKFVPIEIPAFMREQLIKAQTTDEADAIINQINEYLSTQMHYSFWDKLNAWRYFAMLSNPKTWIKNWVGNAVMLGASRGKDIVAATISKPAEYFTKKAVGKGYTYTNPQTVSVRKSAEAKQAATTLMANDNTIENLFSGQNKWSGKSGPQLMQQNSALSNTPILRDLVKIEEKGLNDQPFRLARAKSVLAQSIHANMKNGQIKDLDKFMRVALNQDTSDISNTEKIEYRRLYDAFCKAAASEGDEATFREENKLINDINKLKQNHKVIGALFEGAVPFLKTPANIVKRGLEYNPLGLASTLTKGTYDLKKGKIDANQYVNNLAKGLTGSATMALGAVLGSLGLLSAGNDDEEDEALRKLENSQEYALNIGDISITLDWLTPASLSLFSGVKLAESVVKMMSEDSQFEWKDLLSCANVLIDVIGNTADPMFNLTMLDGIDGAIESISIALQQSEDDSGAAIASLVSYCAENWLVQFLPSITSALSRTIDDTVRTYYTDKNSELSAGAQSFITTVKKKVPWEIKNNPAYLDIWGQPKSSGNVTERIAENFALPFYIEKKANDSATNAIQNFAENNDVAYSDIMPKTAKDFNYKYNGEPINLTQEEYEKMSAAIGEAQKEAVEKHLVRGQPVEIEYTYTNIRSSLKSGKSTKKATFKGNLATAHNTNGWNESDEIEYSYKTDETSGEQSKKAVNIAPASDEDFRAMLYRKMMDTVAEQAKDKALHEIMNERKNKE